MLGKTFALLVLLFTALGFNSRVLAQTGGSAFSNPVTAGQGHTDIDVNSTSNITVTNVYVYNSADGKWEEVPDSDYAIAPNGPDDVFKINFLNGLQAEKQYRIKYSWTTSQTPAVTLTSS